MSAVVHSLTNADIAENYRGVEIYMMRKGFTGPFANWVVQQSPYEVPDFREALAQFNGYVTDLMGGETVKKFDYEELNILISEDAFEKIPAILALNVAKVTSGPGYAKRHRIMHPDYDFIDLGALARNIFYDIIRNHINWDDIA